ncbi:HET-domain-containing protein [Dothidotthia symphoricarpi CBS 119687]|uniref:HET-domain-containing protein n=1 Tax=Dothidotthia symphoricarpi CBS 119687 TaxID=1392245 RepID=A0A6A6A6F7_9PLEO|nr:HET-domain-containing protein [Dothidotthia symphoricarpi CBS 119687]KAF2127469.1 HET-domain-containing protein [Dothidotthia symphoricarpi CBS 119687]
MAEKYKSFAQRNPGDVLSQSNIEVMMEISKQLFKCADVSADAKRVEQVMEKTRLSGDVDSTTYRDLESKNEFLLESTSKILMDMANIMTGYDFENMTPESVLAAMKREGLTGYERDMFKSIEKISPLFSEAFQGIGNNAELAGYSASASFVNQMGSLLEEDTENLSKLCLHTRLELDIEQGPKKIGPSTPYEYQRLVKRNSIRLLSIDHVNEGIIQCSLSEVDLDSQETTYTALSYVWGDYRAPALGEYNPGRAKQEFGINCDGFEILVTLNLYQFLEQQSQHIGVAKKEYYWIDQICINQRDLNEKARQVSMMDKIYKSARQVIAWLGPEDPFTKEAVRTIKYLACLIADLQDKQVERFLSKVQQEGPVDIKMWDALGAVINRAYFNRAWILQEMILAQRLRFYCGSYEISSEELEKCAIAITQSEPLWRYLDAHGKRFTASTQDDIYTQFGHQIAMICEIRKKYVYEPVEDLFFLGRCFDATNAHDHGYALLGLIKERLHQNRCDPDFGLPEPNYGKLVKNTYLEFSKTFLEATGDLRLLSQIEDSSCRSMKSLPSWIPDLTVRLWPQPLTSASNPSGTWCASQNLPFEGVSVRDCILTVRAACIDIVKGAAVPFGNSRAWRDIFWLLDGLRDTSCSNKYLDQALVRTLVTDLHPANESSNEHLALGKDFKYWLIDELARLGGDTGYAGIDYDKTEFLRDRLTQLKSKAANVLDDVRNNKAAAIRAMVQDLPSSMSWLKESSALSKRSDAVGIEAERVYAELKTILSQMKARSTVLPTVRELGKGLDVLKGPDSATKATMTEAAGRFRSRIGLKTKHRRMMRTAKGWLGMGPSSLRVGDRVFVVPGANIPFIMRRLDPGHYEVIGEAYIHGIMHGEANRFGASPFYVGAEYSTDRVLDKLTQLGVVLNATDGHLGMSMQAATYGGHDVAVEKLIVNDAI